MAEKWMGPARAKMEKKGTAGSLRKIAQEKGMLGGKGDSLTPEDLSRLEAMARKMKDAKGHMTQQGMALFRKVQFAKRAMKVKKG